MCIPRTFVLKFSQHDLPIDIQFDKIFMEPTYPSFSDFSQATHNVTIDNSTPKYLIRFIIGDFKVFPYK